MRCNREDREARQRELEEKYKQKRRSYIERYKTPEAPKEEEDGMDF